MESPMSRWIVLFPAVLALTAMQARAAPACVVGQTNNLVVMSIKPLPPGKPWLQSTASAQRILLERCSFTPQRDGTCFFATNVPAGRYYFQEVMTGAMNDLHYPVSQPTLWFEISPIGLTYLGDWQVEFGDEGVLQRLEIRESLPHLDRMQALCEWPTQRLFLGRAKEPLAEVVN